MNKFTHDCKSTKLQLHVKMFCQRTMKLGMKMCVFRKIVMEVVMDNHKSLFISNS